MAEINLPTKTADVTVLPDGTEVWVKTLNSLQQQQAADEANWHAASVCRPYRKGGAKYADLKARFEEEGAEGQAGYLADQEVFLGNIRREALEKYPVAARPERGELSEESYMQACEAWEADGKKADEKRAKYEESLYEKEKKAALALSPKTRLDRALAAAVQRRFLQEYLQRETLETLQRAVRQADDHAKHYYASAQAVEDADDSERLHLIAFYKSLDSLTPAEIPT